MKFKKIRISNIRSYKNQEIEFPDGSLLLAGDVGAGKTSILLAIEYALFGLQPGQKGNSLLRNTEQTGEVVLELELSGNPIKIERKLKRTLKGVSNEYAAITINGQKTESSITEIKSKIVELLGYPPEFVKKNNVLYRYTVHTAQEQMKQIILEDPETRVNILRHVFGIDKYRIIKNNLSILLSDLKSDAKILQGEISTLEQDKENISVRKAALTILHEKINFCKNELGKKSTNRELFEQELKELEKKLEEKKTFEREIEKTQILISTKREILSSINLEIEELKQVVVEAGEPFNEEDYFSLVRRMKIGKDLLEEAGSSYAKLIAKENLFEQERTEVLSKKERIFKIDICPTCLQDVPEHHKHNILNETERKLSEIKNNIEILQKEKTEIFESIEKQKKEINHLEENKVKLEILKSRIEHLQRSRNKLASLEKQKQAVENDQNLLIKHISDFKEKILKYSPFEFKFRKKEAELKQAVLEEKNTEISLAEFEKELELSHKEISLFEEMINQKEQSKKKLQGLNELIFWLSSQFLKLVEITERNVLLKLRKEFSILFRKWFLMLISENSLDSQIDENFTPLILQGETEMDYSYLSGGERTAVALAYRLALNQTINSLMSKIKTRGLIILDEPTDGFSEAQIDKMREILAELNADQLIIVSHEQKIESFVDNVLRVSKEGDISFIEQLSPSKEIAS
ncbi:MAG: AAA family ATPase [Nanoarchaeota archaeon]|nr:AAA family ATPase [Nanoarchaeota archaeon]